MRWKGRWREERKRARKSDMLISQDLHLTGVLRDVPSSMALSGHGRSDDLLPLCSIPCTLKLGIHPIQILQTKPAQVTACIWSAIPSLLRADC